jgi:hypothetical protein
MCMSSTGTNTSNTTSKFEPPSYTTRNPDGTSPLGPGTTWEEFLQRGGDIASKYATDPGLIYGNKGQPLVAQMSDLQNKAANGIYGLASQGSQGEGLSQAYIQSMLQGKQQNIQPLNPYMGSSPEFEDMLKASNKDITDAYGRGTAAQTDASAARSGAYGGSAYNELKASQAKDLSGIIAQNTNQQRNAQFDKSAGLAENATNRAWQGYENAAGRNLQGIGLQQAQGGIDLQRWLATMGAGDTQRGVEAENIAAAKDLFGQNVKQPLEALDIYRSILAAASGQGGSASSSYFGGSGSGLMNGIGSAAALYGLLGK